MKTQRVQWGNRQKLFHILAIFLVVRIGVSFSQRTINLQSQQTASFVLNLSITTTNCTMQIEVVSEHRLLLNESLQQLSKSSNDGLKRIDIHNWQKSAQSIVLRIVNEDPTQNSTLQLQKLILQASISEQDNQHSILILKQNVYDYMLPFNLLSEKYKKVFLDQSQYNLTAVTYNYQPFLQTFWNEHGIDELLLTWIPYFSRCEYKFNHRIFLKDIINPWIYPDFELEETQRICQTTQSWFWGNTLSCSNKNIRTKCILEEFNVRNTKKQPWWMNTNNVLFYFNRPQASDFSFAEAENSKSILDAIAEEYYAKLIQLQYKPIFDLNSETPNNFVLNFKIASITDLEKLQIVKVELIASKVEDTSIQQGQAYLNINVQYLSNFQTLLSYGKSILTYFILFLVLEVLIMIIFKCCYHIFKLNLHFLSICKLIIFPICKGFIMAFFISTIFVLLFFYLASSTKFKAIASTFDGHSIDQSWDASAGRVGFSTLMAGYFLLGIAINQSFKVLTPDQTKIILEDDMIQKYGNDYKKNSAIGEFGEESENEEDKQNFIIKNMNSHRKYLLLCIIGYTFLLSFIYYIRLNFSLTMKIIFLLVVCPVLHKVTIMIYRHVIVKQLIYLTSILMTFQSFMDVLITGSTSLWEALALCSCKLLLQNVLYPGIQVLAEWISFKIYEYLKKNEKKSQEPSNIYRFFNHFRAQVYSVVSQCRYQKSIFYSTLFSIRIAQHLVSPFLMIIIILTTKFNLFCKDLHQTQDQIIITSASILLFLPIDLLGTILGISFFQAKFGLEIIKCLEFNKFKFNRRKAKWMNDIFVQNRCVQHFYRQFQKFCFSSQLYIHTFTVAFAIYTLMMGLKVIMEVSYVSFADPVMLLVLCIVWVTGNLLSVVLSFIVIKLKFYERKEDGKTRAKLDNIEKILKKSDYSEYLQTQAVKNYFIFHCKQWIVENITNIFEKEDFYDNDYELLVKYKHYKSLLKKKQIQQRKKIQRNIEDKLNQTHQENQKDKKIVIKFPRKQFDELAKPLISSWLYMAKQFTFLKSLVKHLKQSKKKQTCQFCSMNIELEVIERNQFASLVNQYRILNVGRMFSQRYFIQFYEMKQQFITVCIQCKDKKFYFEKRHLDMNSTSPQRSILCKWLIIARSRLLNKNLSRNQRFLSINNKYFEE